jgi:ubiquinone/menaquinone biosynthesis C-methylase UbiE
VRALLRLYNMAVFPLLGFLVTGRIRPYRYLYQSIHRFMTAREFSRLALASGYARVSQRRFFFGLVHLIIAERGDNDPAAPRNP